MKKYLPFVNLLLLLIVLCFGFYFWHRVNLISLSIPEHNSNLVESQVGVDWIIGLIDSNFTTVISFVTVLFSMLGIITFVGIREKFKFTIQRLEERFKEQRNESIIHIKRIKSVEGDLSFEVADKNQSRLKKLLRKPDKKMVDYVDYVELSLVTCDYYSKSLLLKSDVYPKFEKSVKGLIKSILSDTAHLISTQEKFKLNTLGYERFLRLQGNIEQVGDLEDKQNLSSIFSKLDFPDLK